MDGRKSSKSKNRENSKDNLEKRKKVNERNNYRGTAVREEAKEETISNITTNNNNNNNNNSTDVRQSSKVDELSSNHSRLAMRFLRVSASSDSENAVLSLLLSELQV
jgi:hypothetical protein